MPLSNKRRFCSLGASALDFLHKLGCTSAYLKQAWLCVRFAQVFFGSFFCIKAKEKNRQLLTESDDERGKVS
jgi:hypothetical protein